MTREDQFIGHLEAYLDECEGLTPLPDTVRDAIRAELPKTKQIGPVIPGLSRFTEMSNPLRIGIAAAVLGVAALIGFTLYQQQVGPSVPTPSPSESQAEAGLPESLRHPYLGPNHEVPDFTGDRSILDFRDGDFGYVFGGTTVFASTVTVTGSGELRFTSQPASGCATGSIGTYAYVTSPGGSVLTIEQGADECVPRGAAIPGTWLRSDCRNPDNWCLGNLEAGTYSSQYFEPRLEGDWQARFGAFTYTVPDGWANYTDYPDTYGLAPQDAYAAVPGDECYDCAGTNDAITLLSDPLPASPDCSESNVDGVGGTANDLAGWLREHPGLVRLSGGSTVLGGRRAQWSDIEVASDWTGTCDPENPFTAVPTFYRPDSYHWALRAGDRWRVFLVDLGGGHTVAIVVDTEPAQLGEFGVEVGPTIGTFDFPEP